MTIEALPDNLVDLFHLQESKEGCYHPFKKGDEADCNNYGGIMLDLSSDAVLERLYDKADKSCFCYIR